MEIRRLVMGPTGSRFESVADVTLRGAQEQRQLICIEFGSNCQSRWITEIACKTAIRRASAPPGPPARQMIRRDHGPLVV